MDSTRGRRSSADPSRSAAVDHTTPASIGEVLSTLFDDAAEAYLVAVDQEHWSLVWRLADLIDVVHGFSEREAA